MIHGLITIKRDSVDTTTSKFLAGFSMTHSLLKAFSCLFIIYKTANPWMILRCKADFDKLNTFKKGFINIWTRCILNPFLSLSFVCLFVLFSSVYYYYFFFCFLLFRFVLFYFFQKRTCTLHVFVIFQGRMQ